MTSSFLNFISGVIEFHEELSVPRLTSENVENSNFGSYASCSDNSSGGNNSRRIVSGTKVCLLILPSHMIPCDILRYFTRPFLDKILSMQILRHIAPHVDKYLALIELDNENSANELISDFNGQPLCTLEEVNCILYSVKSVSLSTADDSNCHTEYDHRDSAAGIHRSTSSGSVSKEHSSAVARFLTLSPPSSIRKQTTRSLSLSSVPSIASPSSDSLTVTRTLNEKNLSIAGTKGNVAGTKGNENPKRTGSATALSPVGGIDAELAGFSIDGMDMKNAGVSVNSISGMLHSTTNIASITASVIPVYEKSIDIDTDSNDFIQQAYVKKETEVFVDNEMQGQGDDYICPVCLEPINCSRPFSFTTACRHTYHIDCISKLEGPQCPVCRFLHDSAFEYLSACSECGWHGTGSGSGSVTYNWPGGRDDCQSNSSSIPRNNHSSSSHSGRHDDNRIAENNSSSSNNRINTNRKTNTNNNSSNECQGEYQNDYGNGDENEYGIPHEEPCDLWVCLVCGFIGCGSSHCDHIRTHYLTHMHAYAMNTGNKSVWDFAGDGWVHRLVLQESNPPEELAEIGMGSGSESAASFAVEEGGQGQNHVALFKAEHNVSGNNKDDYRRSHSNNTDYSNDSGRSSSSTERHIRVKLVEIPDPTNNLTHRPRARAPPLSSGQTELEVNRKLEYAAQHYNRMVTWQLQHNREQYELRVKRLRNFIQREASIGGLERVGVGAGSRAGAEAKNIPGSTAAYSGSVHVINHTSTISSTDSGTWIDKIFQLVATEKAKLLKQTETAKSRILAAEKELDMLKALNHSLKNNKIEWHTRLDAAKRNVLAYENTVSKAANKVKILMEKLDTTTASSSVPLQNPTNTVQNENRESRNSGIIAPSSSSNILYQKSP